MNYRHTILPFLALLWPAATPDETDVIRVCIGGGTIVLLGSTLDKSTKNEVLDLGRPLLFTNTAKAVRTWRNGNMKYGQGSFEIPLAPAISSLTSSFENDQVCLDWGNEAAEDSRTGVITGYRIYRDLIRPAAMDNTGLTRAVDWVHPARLLGSPQSLMSNRTGM